jgi:hypothetical protein
MSNSSAHIPSSRTEERENKNKRIVAIRETKATLYFFRDGG